MPKRKRPQARTQEGKFIETSTYTAKELYAAVSTNQDTYACWPIPYDRYHGVVRRKVWYLNHPDTGKLTRAINILWPVLRHEDVFANEDAQSYPPCSLFKYYHYLTANKTYPCSLKNACLNPLHFTKEIKIVITQNTAYSIFHAMLREPTRILKLPAASYEDAVDMRRKLWAHRNNFRNADPRGREFAKQFFFTTLKDGVQIQSKGQLTQDEKNFLDLIGVDDTREPAVATEAVDDMLFRLKEIEDSVPEDDTPEPESVFDTYKNMIEKKT